MKIKTKFGVANIGNRGYYIIVSHKEGNFNKLLHRLIFEDFYQIKLPDDWIIHHEDGNKLNNEIWNLIPMTTQEHTSLHNKGENHWLYGKSTSEETKQKISEANKGQKRSMDSKMRISKSRNSSGYFRVCKRKRKGFKQGFVWSYDYLENNKRKTITSVDLVKLEKKVKAKGLDWFIVDENKAMESN